jgi:hypothetical protein
VLLVLQAASNRAQAAVKAAVDANVVAEMAQMARLAAKEAPDAVST